MRLPLVRGIAPEVAGCRRSAPFLGARRRRGCCWSPKCPPLPRGRGPAADGYSDTPRDVPEAQESIQPGMPTLVSQIQSFSTEEFYSDQRGKT